MPKDALPASRYLFFTGKGGVGKTSIACATALNLTDAGKRVLLVSTDPASNLDDVFGIRIGTHPTTVDAVKNMMALNLDPAAAAEEYRERTVGAYQGILPEAVVSKVKEQLSGACTTEIATFDLFTRLLADKSQTAEFDNIIFDTAPTGHTLRLLALPKAWSGFLEENTHGESCIGPLAGLTEDRLRYEQTVSALANPGQSTFVLVARADRASLLEAERASKELVALDMRNQHLIVNGLLADAGTDLVARAFRRQQEEQLASLPAGLRDLPTLRLPLLPAPPSSIDGLRSLASVLLDDIASVDAASGLRPDQGSAFGVPDVPRGLAPVIQAISHRDRGIVMVMGKGGVGKTTVAAAVALELAKTGRTVHLTTTDPAAHLDITVAGGDVGTANLRVSRIDAAAEVEAYRQEVMRTAGASLDDDGRALLAEDLASPCTEEIAVFRAFARVVDEVDDGFVVLDTAPTGHTLLLLDASQAYHRQVERTKGEAPTEVRQLLPRLRNPEMSQVLLVTLPQATPVLEASRLQADLLRAGITPTWWVINQAFTGLETENPTLRSLAAAERTWFEKVSQTLASQTVYIPWQMRPPVGKEGLEQLM